MTMRTVEEVLAFFETDDPSEIEIADLHPHASADLRAASDSARDVAERRRRGEYLVRSPKGESGVDRGTAAELRRLGAPFTGKLQPDPLSPE